METILVTVSGETHIDKWKASRAISRRELGQRLLSLIALGALPGVSSAHPICRLLVDGTLPESFGEGLSSENYKAVFLSSAQLAALERIAEAIVPGSQKAHSGEFIDLLLSVDSSDSQRRFADALAAFDTAAQHSFHQNAVSLSGEQIAQLLRAASDSQSGDFKHFENVKGWVVGAYYSSEIGMRELGWTPDRIFNSYPVCARSESHS